MYQHSLQAAARTTVIWISIDGMRGDYVQRGEFPFFVRLRREAATTDKLRPVFPSITFPSHCSEATGVTVEKHGITANAFYDAATKTQYSYPNDSSLLQAEPIWLTAQRQGVRTAVLDWPLSFAQKGPIRTEIFDEKFEFAMPDEQRLNRLLDAWSASLAKADPVPLHLLMGYVIATDKPGHNNGPDSPEILQAMITLDAQLAKFSERAVELWKRQRKTPEDRLFFVFSTDHGMSTVKTLLYSYRVALTGIHLLTTGDLEPNLSILAPRYRFHDVAELIDRKRAGTEHGHIDPALDEHHRTRWPKLEELLAEAEHDSILPTQPPNHLEIDDWLIALRLSQV